MLRVRGEWNDAFAQRAPQNATDFADTGRKVKRPEAGERERRAVGPGDQSVLRSRVAQDVAVGVGVAVAIGVIGLTVLVSERRKPKPPEPSLRGLSVLRKDADAGAETHRVRGRKSIEHATVQLVDLAGETVKKVASSLPPLN